MKRQYNKPPLSFEEQLTRLINRGLLVSDKPLAISKLSTIIPENWQYHPIWNH